MRNNSTQGEGIMQLGVEWRNYPKKLLGLVKPLGSRGLLNWLSDENYLKLVYKGLFVNDLNLSNPKTFNEKLQWLKINYRKPEMITLADKYAVRSYVRETIGGKYLVPIIALYKDIEDINWKELPDKFVLKCTHGSGANIICTDKSTLDVNLSKKKLKHWLNKNWYWYGREWPYKDIEPRIICEEYLVDESGTELKDYKFMCFNGEPKIIQLMSKREKGNYLLNHFDLKWNEIDIPRKTIKRNPRVPAKPENLTRMIEISKVLSKGIPFVRIDLYETGKGVFFGEITFYPVSGFMDFERDSDDCLLGSWIKLPIQLENYY